ncbi:MAG: right-handed parallel beta-helix repeat-containing protein, partial [Candidatus Latescibacteria bacterium]|nr:right-handed parallel beta-helix repeat-containing protein [Candidatus Latescibacterota bacterium]
KGAGEIYPLSGYHNYGMCDVPLKSAAGLEVGMTVSVHDGRSHGGFMETFATITWIDGDWVGLDHGIEMDYSADEAPCLTTVYPLVFGHRIHNAAVRDMRLEGNRAANKKAMGGCRGGAIYFGNSRGIEISGIFERDFWGEGLSFQMCRDVQISDSAFDENTGNGLHPGAGSTNALFERCRGHNNGRSGFFFCVRANHITVRDCDFAANALGVSIGTRDCYNAIEACRIEDNRGPGVLVRPAPRPTEVHSVGVQRCRIANNARSEGRAQVEITSDAHALIVTENEISGVVGDLKPAIYAEESTRDLYLVGNLGLEGEFGVQAGAGCLVEDAPEIETGYGEWSTEIFRHLPC